MLRLILPVLLLALGVGGGVGAGIFLAPAAPAAPDADGDSRSGVDALASGTAAVTPEASAGPAVPGPGESVGRVGGASEYVRLNNQFVVPIVRNGSVRSLVVMSLTLEVDAGQNGLVFDQEPRLRDAFLQVMFAHANAGGFDGSFTESAAMDPLREALQEAAERVLGQMARDVLIVDITRQDA